MKTPAENLSIWILLLSFGYTCGNSVLLTSDSGQDGQPLELKCQLTLTGTFNPLTVNWYLNSYSVAIERDALNCDPVSSPSVYDLSRYTFSCKPNVFTLTIKALSLADNGSCWRCRVLFTDTTPTNTDSKCITVGQLALILGLSLGLGIGCIISICITLICCGCLDCCKCCRIFNHYQESKCCYMTCYCLEKGCCSFFYCRPGDKRGRFFCGCKSKAERCGGCYFCQKICGCGWPDFCKSKRPRSCGDCFCICCVDGMKDEALLDVGGAVPVHQQKSPAINGSPTIHTGTQNKVESKRTTLPPLATKQLTLDEEPKKKKKEKHGVENNKGKTAEEKWKKKLPEGQAVHEEED
ncbi:hypothetical protein CHS0354_025671 [Potamilus streckersoni]|uniref:Ig-like domain-containing protein n=1 Tax=Potamilus streckersoni TaxID=2493646 RepID=A0AAE0T2I4_9BIVA|nr:hypothetical protein CHS0354_025671 [Potamilus streckersoni]